MRVPIAIKYSLDDWGLTMREIFYEDFYNYTPRFNSYPLRVELNNIYGVTDLTTCSANLEIK